MGVGSELEKQESLQAYRVEYQVNVNVVVGIDQVWTSGEKLPEKNGGN